MDKSVEFFNKVKNDPALQQKIKAVKESVTKNYVEKVLAIAKEAGYSLDPKTLKEAYKANRGQLTEAELEKVSAAGGGSRGDCNSGSVPLY